VRSDPSDSGGLFIGRRPGTARIRYAEEIPPAGPLRRRVDGSLANLLLAGMAAISLLCWGPIPVGCLWIGSRVEYLLGNVEAGIAVSFGTAFASLFGTLSVLRRLDHLWILVRRAAGHDQRSGALGRIFAVAAVVGTAVFAAWLLVIVGPNDPNL
jgi:hypothetical protein